MKPQPSWVLVACVAIGAHDSLFAEVLDKTKSIAGTAVHYKVVLPRQYDPEKPYPGVLAFPGGSQAIDIAENMVKRNWRDEAERRGYIVLISAATNGRLFFQGGEEVFPEFLDKLLADYKIRDGKFHIAGNSNGGISAFHIAAMYPQYFLSVTGFPGYLPDESPDRVRALKDMCINMHVGELDDGWPEEMTRQASSFQSQGMTVRFTVEKGQGHRLDTLAGEGAARLFNQFEEARHGCAK
jgi:predicted esterase